MIKQPIITLTTDFGVQSQGIGNMEVEIAINLGDFAKKHHIEVGDTLIIRIGKQEE